MIPKVGSSSLLEEGKEASVRTINQPHRPFPLRLLQFLLLLLGLGILVLFLNMYASRHLKVQTDVVVIHSRFQPCVEQPLSIQSWIRPPLNLLHRMNDSELFWRALFSEFQPSSAFFGRQVPSQNKYLHHGYGFGSPYYGGWGWSPFSFFFPGPGVAVGVGGGFDLFHLAIVLGAVSAFIRKFFQSRQQDDDDYSKHETKATDMLFPSCNSL